MEALLGFVVGLITAWVATKIMSWDKESEVKEIIEDIKTESNKEKNED